MSDVFAEIDEAMRQERMEKFWKENGKSVLILIAITIVATGAVSGFRSWNAGVKERQTAELIALLDNPAFPENVKNAELELRGGLKGIALLTTAGAFVDDKKPADALPLYERASADRKIPGDLRALATLSAVRLLAEQGKPDTAALIKRLEPVWENNKSPWRFSAHMDAAQIYAGAGDYIKAREHLALVKSGKDLPDMMAQRAAALDQIYALKSGTQEQTP